MSLKTWDKAGFDAIYDVGLEPDGHPNTRPEVRGHYERSAIFNANDPRLDFVTPEWSAILDHFDWPLTTRIAIIGCGFGWSMEYLDSRGYSDTYGSDTSTYILREMANIDPRTGLPNALLSGRIQGSDLSVNAGRRRFIRNTIGRGNQFDVIVTERVLSSLSDLEAQEMSTDLHDAMLLSGAGAVIHVENDGPAAGLVDFNEKALADWKKLIPSDSFVASGGRRFVD